MSGLDSIFLNEPKTVFIRFGNEGELRLYVADTLKEYRIVLKKKNGKCIHLAQAMKVIVDNTKPWVDDRQHILSDAVYFLHNLGEVRVRSLMEFGAGFFFGSMLQRLFVNQEVDVSIIERAVGAAEMDTLLKEHDEE